MTTQINSGVYMSADQCSDDGCSGDYATLSGYNRPMGSFVAGPPVPSQTAVQSVVIVPSWGGYSYNTLQNNLTYNQLSTSGYFSISNAYPSYGNSCQAYTTSLASAGNANGFANTASNM
jgi:hypothetical protein